MVDDSYMVNGWSMIWLIGVIDGSWFFMMINDMVILWQ